MLDTLVVTLSSSRWKAMVSNFEGNARGRDGEHD